MKKEMKGAFLAALLLVIVGICGFLYRNSLQAPTRGTNQTTTCPVDTKACADGSSVARSGPSCTFAACPLPNVELPEAEISFVIPGGYTSNENAHGTDSSLLAAYEKSAITASSTQPDSIVVRRYQIPEGKDANSVILSETTFESSGEKPTSVNEFTPVIINGKTYQMVVVERFEALVHVEYYLPRDKDVLRFEALQHNVNNWTDPSLNIRTLPAVSALEGMLATLQQN